MAPIIFSSEPLRARFGTRRIERAELGRLSGDHTAQQRELREAHRLFTEMGAPIRAAEIAKELALATAS